MGAEELLNYGIATTFAVLLLFFIIKTFSGILDRVVHDQSVMMHKMAETLNEVASTLKVIQDNIKDLQTGQSALWSEIRNLKRRERDDWD